MLRYRTLVLSVFCFCLAACSAVPNYFNAYKIDVQQGNVLSQDMVSQLKPGQTRDQVRFILGTPLITDIFHQQRWDYVYRYHTVKLVRLSSASSLFILTRAIFWNVLQVMSIRLMLPI
jgi:outer membrane protein assembly factor BamE